MSKTTRGYKQTQVGVIPNDWEIKTFGDIAEITMGQSPMGTSYNQNEKGIALINGPTEFTVKHPIKIQWTSQPTKLCKEGDILICVRGSSTGRMNISDDVYCIGRGVAAIRAKPQHDNSFLEFQTYNALKIILSLTSGSTFPNIDGKSLKSIKIPLPSAKAEQTTIATALSDADALISSLEKLIAKKRNIKQGAMQQLLTGKKRLPGFSGKWEVKKLGEIAHIDPENLGSDTSPNYSFRYISLEDVGYGTLRGHTELVFCIAPSRARRKVRKGDVLVSTVRPNLKSHLLIRDDVVDTVCSTGFSVVRYKPALADPAFIFAHLFAGSLERQIESLLTGSNYPAINSSDVKALRIPCPSLPEQTAIAQVLSDMDAEIAALEKKLEKYKRIKQGMMQELLTGKTRLV